MMPTASDESSKLETPLVFMETGHLGRTAERLGTAPVSVHGALHSQEAALPARCCGPASANPPDRDGQRNVAPCSSIDGRGPEA